MRDPEFSKYISLYQEKFKEVEKAKGQSEHLSRLFNAVDKGPDHPPSAVQIWLQDQAIIWINAMHRAAKELSELEKYIQIRFADVE